MVARLCDYTIGNIALLGFTQRQAILVYNVPLWNVKQSRARAWIRLRGKLVALKSCNVEWRFYYNSREREPSVNVWTCATRNNSSQNRLKCTPPKRKKLFRCGSAYRREEFDKRDVLLLQMLANCNWESVHDPRIEIFMIDRNARDDGGL